MARPRLSTPSFRLTQRGGTYYVKWWWDDRWNRVSTRTADRREAERFLAQFTAATLTPEPPAQPTISAILDGYLADRKPVVASYATLEYACAALRRHLGDLLPLSITTPVARLYAVQRRAEGYEVGKASARRRKAVSDSTIAREVVTLRAAIRWAIGEKWLTPDQEPAIEAPRAAPPRERWLSRDEAGRLLAACGAPHILLFSAVALYTAARRSAILELRWRQVDLEAGMIDFGRGTGNKRRAVVPISDALLPYLVEAHEHRTSDSVIEFAGGPVADVKTGFMAAARRAKLPGVTPHVLRHTAATWAAMRGVPMDEIARMLGDSVRTAERVYAKYSPDYLRRAVAAVSG